MVLLKTGHAKYLDSEAIDAIEAGDVDHVQFPSTQVASADANALDDYEEGDWTGTIQDDSLSDAESQTYAAQTGTYIKIGQLVTVTGRIVLSSLGALTTSQQARIAGLPFTIANVTNQFAALNVTYGAGLSITSAANVSGIGVTNATYANLYEWDAVAGVTILTLAELSADGDIMFSMTYEVE